MNTGRCLNQDCNAAITKKCHIGSDTPGECPNWTAVEKKNKVVKKTTKVGGEIPWSGEDFKIDDIEKVSRHITPFLIGTVGQADSGKTSFLGALYTLLANGHRLNDFTFAGSQTLLRWEYLMRKLKFERGNVSFPPPTPSAGDYYSFLHMALRNTSGKINEMLFADLSGEVFTNWAVDANDQDVENVRWLIEFADGFLFFVNARTIAEKKMAGVYDILDIAERLKQNLNGRPVIPVWSKADYISSVSAAHLQKIETELSVLFGHGEIYQISNYLDVNADPDPRSMSNLRLVNDLANLLSSNSTKKILIDRRNDISDLFLTYRGHEER